MPALIPVPRNATEALAQVDRTRSALAAGDAAAVMIGVAALCLSDYVSRNDRLLKAKQRVASARYKVLRKRARRSTG